MTRVSKFGIIGMLAVGAMVAPVFAGGVTVGRFYSELARAKHLAFADAASAESNLRGAGYNLPKLALDKDLTEGDLTSISTALGLAVRTERPSQLVGETQMNTFMAAFGSHVGTPAERGDSPFQTDALPPQSGKGKGKKKGHHKSTSEPI